MLTETMAVRTIKAFLKSYRRPKQWRAQPEDQPWFDQPNGMQLLEQRRKTESLTDKEFEDLRHWHDHGYVVLQNIVPDQDIEEMLQDLDHVWNRRDAIPNLVIDDLRLKPGDPVGFPHADLVALDQETKDRMKRDQHWRIHSFYKYSHSTNRIFHNPALQRLASLILKREVKPYYSINFTFGSAQKIHQDTAVFFVFPKNYLVGAWLAGEDIHPDSGPLVYYPGSHKESLLTSFNNYPQTNLKTCDKTISDEYYRHLDKISERYERKTFVAKKGEVFLWHGMLIHGGDTIRNPALTRRSYVCHYMPPSCNKESEMHGPFNW